MPTEHYTLTGAVNRAVETVEYQYKLWDNSPRDAKGDLQLRANRLTWKTQKMTHISHQKNGSVLDFTGSRGLGCSRGTPGVELNNQSLNNIAGARYQRNLGRAEAALLISAVKWKETLKLLTEKAKAIDQELEKLDSGSKNSKKKFRIRTDELGNKFLEYKFGIKPLVDDYLATAKVLALLRVPPITVKGACRENVLVTTTYSGNPIIVDQMAGIRRVTLSSRASVASPNIWLAQQLGLIGLTEAAWDWVPWSFIVNMFSNINAVISSMVPDGALLISDKATTRTLNILRESTATWSYRNVIRCNVNYRTKERTLLNHPPVTLRFRWPSDPLGAAQTLAALTAQRARGIAIRVPTLLTS